MYITLIQQSYSVRPFLSIEFDFFLEKLTNVLAGFVNLMVLVVGIVQEPGLHVVLVSLIVVLTVTRSVHIHATHYSSISNLDLGLSTLSFCLLPFFFFHVLRSRIYQKLFFVNTTCINSHAVPCKEASLEFGNG